MKNKTLSFLFRLGLPFAALLLPVVAQAHENYVLTKAEITADLAAKGPNVFSALQSAGNLRVAITVGICSAVGVILYFLFQYSALGQKFEAAINKLEGFGHVILRIALAASLLASANFNSFLGPEIPLTSIPFGIALKYFLYVLGIMLLLGLWSEIVGTISLCILLLATWVYKDYMLTYANYFGEFVALMLFGSRVFSVDGLVYKTKTWAKKYHNLELAVIRITYGVSIMYPAITYKLLHAAVIIDIVKRYNLTQFHWLFPHDPLLISLGTGLAQVAVGLCLIFGFETRLNTLVTFVLLVMSVTYFKEAVWPHYILLALCLYLIINNGGDWSLDYYIQTHKQQLKNWLLRRIA